MARMRIGLLIVLAVALAALGDFTMFLKTRRQP